MPNLWLVPLVLFCTINPDRDRATPGGSIDGLEAARWGGGARVTGSFQRAAADDDAPLYVALTFDDGPSATVTPRILATLEEYEVTATFFAVGWRFEGAGKRARAQAAVLRDVARRGFPIGNHTVNHDDLTAMTRAEARHQVDYNERMLVRELGRRPYLFRAPYGRIDGATRAYVEDRGYTEIRWNIDSHDYLPRLARAMPERVVADLVAKRGGVVLLHDTKPWTADALPGLLAALERENCRRRDLGERLLVPVTLDFFMRDRDGAPRPLPEAAKASETRYLERLNRVCATH